MKRVLDVVISVLALAVFALPMLIIAAVIRWQLGKPILYAQERAGRDGHPFRLYKFRTMRQSSTTDTEPWNDVHRVTPFGKWLRSTSLDELPQLWNVLRGDLSLVGPRPLLMEYLPLYSREQMRRHEVLPGMTGWAQVNGRNSVSWEQKFELDVWYVDNRSFLLDLKILALTLVRVLFRDGITQHRDGTTTKFTGSH